MRTFNQDSLNAIRDTLGDADFVSVCRSLAVANLVESKSAEPEEVLHYFKEARNFLDSVLDVSDDLLNNLSEVDSSDTLEEDCFGCCHCCVEDCCCNGDDDDDILEETSYCKCSEGSCDGCTTCFRHGCPSKEVSDEVDLEYFNHEETPSSVTTYRISTSGLD